MELLVVLGFIVGIIWLSSNRSQSRYSSPKSSINMPSKVTVQSPQVPPADLPQVGTAGFQKSGADTVKPSPVTPSSEFSRGTASDDFCNKCGKRWRRWDNNENGGYWFSCSGYPRCDNTRDKQLREKYCANGHRRTPTNTAYTANGHRRCLICRPLSGGSVLEKPLPKKTPDRNSERKRDVGKVLKSDKSCRNGHPRTAENTYIRPDGERECRICRRNARK